MIWETLGEEEGVGVVFMGLTGFPDTGRGSPWGNLIMKNLLILYSCMARVGRGGGNPQKRSWYKVYRIRVNPVPLNSRLAITEVL